MESINAIYKFGNLYDKTTKKRIVISDGAEVSIVITSAEDILPEDPNLSEATPLNAKEKEKEIQKFCNKQKEPAKYWKLFESGKTLYFEISAGIKTGDKQVKKFEYIFKVQILEDLYIYNKKKEAKYARFFDCRCKVKECFPEFEFFEPIAATSLNDAYTKTYELYFAMFGKSTCNAFDRFSETPDMKSIIRGKTESIQEEKKEHSHY